MGIVISLFDKDLIGCRYFALGDEGIAISMRDESLQILPLNLNEFEVILGEESKVYKRAELAEFLKAAGVLVDSEDRHMPKLDLIGLNYL